MCRPHLGSARGDLNAIGLLNTPRTQALDQPCLLVKTPLSAPFYLMLKSFDLTAYQLLLNTRVFRRVYEASPT